MEASRRQFVQGAGIAGAALAALGTASVAVADEAVESDAPEAQPIAPVDVPEAWDVEADIVIVGAGGAGVAGALLARDNDCSVVVLEKDFEAGGATQHANAWLASPGSGRRQAEAGYAWPEFPYNRDKFVAAMQREHGFTLDSALIGNMADKSGECADWLDDHGCEWGVFAGGAFYMYTGGDPNNFTSQIGMIAQISQLGVDAGADYRFNEPVSALVAQDGAVVGVQTTKDDGTVTYYKANKGVVLCSGGFGMNRDMLKVYCPTLYKNAAYGGPVPTHTGECTRMALGMGADMAGIDSWSCWESAPDNGTKAYHYFYGVRQLFQMTWPSFDKMGKRVEVYDTRIPEVAEIPFVSGFGQDSARAAAQMACPGGHAYTVLPANFEDYLESIGAPGERNVMTPEQCANQNYFDPDWKVEFQYGLDDGRVKKADTIEELAEMLDVPPANLRKAVDDWNAICAKGVDDDPNIVYHYPAEWLNPIEEGPFYGAAISGQIGKTLAGVRVDENLHVVNTDGEKIPGLYAAFTTAGGIVGESEFGGGCVNTSMLGGNALSWVSGYFATQSAINGL